MTWDEIVYSIKKEKNKEIAVIEGEKFLKFSNLIFIRVDENVLSKAQNLISEYNINPRDAIHIATALIINAKQIISDDPNFDKVKEIRRQKVG